MADKQATTARPLQIALGAVWRADHRGTVTAGLLQLVGALSGLGVVLASKLALDALVADSTAVSGALVAALVLLAATTAVSGSVSALQTQHQRVLGERVAQGVWQVMLRACVAVDLVVWESTAFMDRLDRVRGNALQRPVAVVTALFTLIGAVLGVISLLVVLLAIHPLLVPTLLAAAVPAVVSARLASRAEFAFTADTSPIARRRLYLKQLMTGREFAAEVRAFDSGDLLLGRHAADDSAYLTRLVRQARRRQGLGLLTALSAALALGLTLAVIVWLVDAGRLSLAEAGAAAIAARLLGSRLTSAYGSVGVLIESGPFLADLHSFVGEAPGHVVAPARPSLQREVRVEQASFGYAGAGRLAVDGVSLRIARGQVVAVVGENGSGKTTLAKLVAGLYEPQSGQVTWDGRPIPTPELRAGVSVLFQDFVRYRMSGRDNIAIAQATASVDDERVRAAARRAGLDDVLSRLPDGYDTILGIELAEGSDLSGGQWQRLALARAFYRDTPVLVLDEPTAAMDPRAEHELFADVRRVLDGRSALLISHRYSSVRLADHIYVMDQGRVVEEGTHDELVALEGRYAELYALQAAAYLTRA